jgi:hypothetical protein
MQDKKKGFFYPNLDEKEFYSTKLLKALAKSIFYAG